MIYRLSADSQLQTAEGTLMEGPDMQDMANLLRLSGVDHNDAFAVTEFSEWLRTECGWTYPSVKEVYLTEMYAHKAGEGAMPWFMVIVLPLMVVWTWITSLFGGKRNK